jgi:excisionase family DNA binding protein
MNVVPLEPIVLRVSEAALLLEISRSKAYELVAAGQIPSVRLGGSVRVPLDQLRAWIARQTTGGSDSTAS